MSLNAELRWRSGCDRARWLHKAWQWYHRHNQYLKSQ